MRKVLAASILMVLCVGCATTSTRQLHKDADYSWVRGANFIPSYAANSVEIWKNFDADVIDRELGYAESIGLNSVRVFLQYHVYEQHPKQFIADVATFVDLCEAHDIRPMLITFDACMAVAPSMASDEFWVASPGWDRVNPLFYPKGEQYVRDLVEQFRGDDRILLWDVMNEPTVSPQGMTERGKDEVWNFVRHFAAYFKEIGATQPLTSGVVGYDSSEIVDYVDVLSLHTYAADAETLRTNIADLKTMADEAGKSCIITEVGAPAWGCTYEMAMPVLEEEQVGFYLWEVMISKTVFRSIAGLFYPDGTVRQRSSIEAILGHPAPEFVEKPDAEGIPLGSGAPSWEDMYVRMLDRMVKTPTNEENWHERYTMLFNGSIFLFYWGDRLDEIGTGTAAARGFYDFGLHDVAFPRLDEMLKLAHEVMAEKQKSGAQGAEQ